MSISYTKLHLILTTFTNSPSLHWSLSFEIEPSNYQATSRDSGWAKSMETEIDALNNNHTWDFVDMPINASLIGRKWVYKIKRHADRSIERFKARLVAHGCNQTEGLNYFFSHQLLRYL